MGRGHWKGTGDPNEFEWRRYGIRSSEKLPSHDGAHVPQVLRKQEDN